MKSKEEFRERVENGEFNEELKTMTSAEEIVEFASQLGYGITIEDVLTAELSEDQLALIAGGKRDTHNTTNNNNIINGNGNTQVNFR